MSLALYIFINTDLKMKPGKWGAQVGHSIQYIIENLSNKSEYTQNNYHLWRNSGARKIILKATEKEMEKIYNSFPSEKVHDAGLNHVKAGSFTCLAVYPKEHNEDFKNFKLM